MSTKTSASRSEPHEAQAAAESPSSIELDAAEAAEDVRIKEAEQRDDLIAFIAERMMLCGKLKSRDNVLIAAEIAALKAYFQQRLKLAIA